MSTSTVDGVTYTEVRVEAYITRIALFEMLPKVAVMVAVPLEMAVARPLLFTVAKDVLEDFQATWVVISWLVPSE